MKLCIHGHFYQPPREDPISNFIPDETGAEPYANWNERILAECYEPNAQEGNFSKLSFNVGPTLFQWLDSAHPETVSKIVASENETYRRDGTGNGMAQGFNHIILPLAKFEDKVTQIRWGISDFEARFGHKPQGFWLPETAADLETLTVLSDHGIRFTILAPWQVIPETEGFRGPVSIDLPDGRPPFIVFPYDQDFSTKVSFVPSATVNGDEFLSNLTQYRNGNSGGLVLIASDRELYGHHQPFRDLFLKYLLGDGAEKFGIELTYPEKWLKENPVPEKATLVDDTSWSCLHGVSRWSGGCSCTPGSEWKHPLRVALNQIADWVDGVYLDIVSPLLPDPWELRHRFVEVMAHQTSLSKLWQEVGGKTEDFNDERMTLLMRAQYERQRMYTSCGFFFSDFHRIEPQNNVAYAANAVWLTKKVSGTDISPAVLKSLADVRSNNTGLRADTVFLQTLVRAENESGFSESAARTLSH